MSDSAAGTSSAKRFRFSGMRAAIAVASAAIAFLLFLRFDVAIMAWCDRAGSPESGSFLDQVRDGLRNYSQVLSVITICIVVAAFDRRRRQVITALLIAQVLANLTYNAVRHTVARHRPLSAVVSIAPFEDLKIDDTWLGWQPGNTVRATQSFPSGHTAAALALTGVLAFYYSRIAWMFWILALGCGVSRVLDLQHWLTDCVAGALIGYLAAIAALALTQQLFSGPRQAIGPSRIPSRG